ncbi:hypothetical protein [Actinomadura chokoriensis]|uniref:Uncharacterized protein n=1 Tax=Actinomadura chokoriensis TaxID=454156 RepID=A0ABV4QXF9_9ACTN
MSSQYVTSSTVRRVAGAGLVVAAAGIPIQIAGGADYPAVPPGLIILLAAAALVLTRWRWALIVATIVPVFLGIGGAAASDFRHQLTDPGETLAFTGSVLQVIGLLIALVFCAAAIREAFGGRAGRADADRRTV